MPRSSNGAVNFAALLTLGPGESEFDRALDLVASLLYYEATLSHLVLVNDSSCDLSILDAVLAPYPCTVVTLPHPRPNSELNKYGGLLSAELVALTHIHHHYDVEFVLKLDADSLIIAPFSQRLHTVLQSDPAIGLVGVLGNSCNRATRNFQMDAIVRQGIFTAVQIGLSSTPLSSEETFLLKQWGVATTDQETSFRRVSKLIAPILKKEFSGAHCQGGAYAISERMISRLKDLRAMEEPLLWKDLRVGEDQLMGALCTLADLRAIDCSDRGEVFGVQARGLAYSPCDLLNYGYSIIHSVKDDLCYSETEIQSFFKRTRQPRYDCRPS